MLDDNHSSAGADGLPNVRDNVQSSGRRKVPARVAERPHPELWAQHELLTFAEAAALFWPDGLLTVSTLRTAAKNGQLAVADVAGRLFTSPAALHQMAACRIVKDTRRASPEKNGGFELALKRILGSPQNPKSSI
jgi:hypothetical protein